MAHTEQSERVRLAESRSVPRDVYAKRSNPTGTRVSRTGTVAFVRSGVARVIWDDGQTSEEWFADLERR